MNYDDGLLNERNILIERNQISGNTKEARLYKSKLPAEFSNPILSWVIGLALGDASIQVTGKQVARLKIQQTFRNVALLEATMQILLPWCVQIGQPSKEKRPDMWEITTLSHSAFFYAGKVLGVSDETPRSYKIVNKVIPTDIIQYLDPIAISAWFCCDGGRRDYGINEGKAIQFHTQGFSKEGCDRLAAAVKEPYGWNAQVIFDYANHKGEFYLVQIEASSFDSFEATIKTYVLPEFWRKLPTSRSPKSRFKTFI